MNYELYMRAALAEAAQAARAGERANGAVAVLDEAQGGAGLGVPEAELMMERVAHSPGAMAAASSTNGSSTTSSTQRRSES